jgi:TonB family protein
MSYRIFRSACALLLILLTASIGHAQESQGSGDLRIKPIYVTARIFQLRVKRGAAEELSDQVFKMKTSSLAEYDQWQKSLGKTYPGADAALLRTEQKRVFRTSKPTVLSLLRQPDGRALEAQLLGAQSPGDGTTPGTSLIPEIALHFGNDAVHKPVVYAIKPLEIESGMTYFFAVTNLKLIPTDYVKFVRPNARPESFEGSEVSLVFAFSVELEKPSATTRVYDEQQSAELQEKAVRHVQPVIPEKLRELSMGGVVRVQVEITPAGKVGAANVHGSTFPEMNGEAIAAARQWEFPPSIFAENKTPVSAFLTFHLTSEPPKKPIPAPPGNQ